MASGRQSKTHIKRNSLHRRRGLELNTPGAIAGVSDSTAQQQLTLDNPYMSQSQAYNMDMQLYPGMIIQLDGFKGLAMILTIIGDMIGCELEGPFGHSDGIWQDIRYFQTPPNCAVFVPNETVKRILKIEAPPRFISRTHDLHVGDVVMVSKSVGVGVVRHASTHLIGTELNAPVGDCDGQFEGQRYFQVKANHALFVNPQTLKKIEAEDLLNKLNETVERLQEIEHDLQYLH